MAVNSGLVTQGTAFDISKDGLVWTRIGCVESWDLATSDRAEIDTTCLLDTSKTFKFGLKDNGTLSVELMFSIDGPGQVLLEESYASSEPYHFQIEYSDNAGVSGSIKTFEGFVTNMSESGAKDDIIKQSINIKISGDIQLNAPVA